MCQITHYKSPTCSHSWLKLDKPCTQYYPYPHHSTLLTCPYLSDNVINSISDLPKRRRAERHNCPRCDWGDRHGFVNDGHFIRMIDGLSVRFAVPGFGSFSRVDRGWNGDLRLVKRGYGGGPGYNYGHGGYGYSPYQDGGYALAALNAKNGVPPGYEGYAYPSIGYPGYGGAPGPYNAISQGQVYPHGMMGGYLPYATGMPGYYPRYSRERRRKERSGGFEPGPRAFDFIGWAAGANRPWKDYKKLVDKRR